MLVWNDYLQGFDGGPDSLIKYNPLSNVSSAEVWNFLRVMVRFPNWNQQDPHESNDQVVVMILSRLVNFSKNLYALYKSMPTCE